MIFLDDFVRDTKCSALVGLDVWFQPILPDDLSERVTSIIRSWDKFRCVEEFNDRVLGWHRRIVFMADRDGSRYSAVLLLVVDPKSVTSTWERISVAERKALARHFDDTMYAEGRYLMEPLLLDELHGWLSPYPERGCVDLPRNASPELCEAFRRIRARKNLEGSSGSFRLYQRALKRHFQNRS